MCVLHEHFESFLDSDVNHLSLLIVGADRQRAHAHVRCAADGCILLNENDVSAVFRCLYRCRKT